MTHSFGHRLCRFGAMTVLTLSVAVCGADSGCSRTGAQTSEKAESTKSSGGAATERVYISGDDVEKLSDVFAGVAKAISAQVVSISVESKQARPKTPFDFFFNGQQGDDQIVRGSGSGVIITSDGYILTNNHVVKDSTRIDVGLQDRRRFKGRVVGTDPATDLAIVKINATELPAAKLADSSKARVGEWVLAIGSPFGLDYTVTAGVLSATGRGGLGANEIEDYLQTDASINPGNSGGPLVNLKGEVLGINTMIVGRGTGIGFAIPSNMANNVAKQLRERGQVRRAWIGVGFQELTPELAKRFGVKSSGGALISNVVAGAPAKKAGLKAGDVITKVDGKPINQGNDLLRAVLAKPVGSILTLTVVRSGKTTIKKLKTDQRPKDASQVEAEASNTKRSADGFGLELQKLTPGIAEQLGVNASSGVVAVSVANGSSAERAGLQRGDVIVEADKKAVSGVEDVVAALEDGSALLRVERRGGAVYLVLSKD